MGCMFGGRLSGCDTYEKDTDTTPNPNKYRFTVLRVVRGLNNLVFLEVRYPECTTFSGIKYLVLDCPVLDWGNLKELDPHFLEDGNIVARFVPTLEGYEFAMRMIRWNGN